MVKKKDKVLALVGLTNQNRVRHTERKTYMREQGDVIGSDWVGYFSFVVRKGLSEY